MSKANSTKPTEATTAQPDRAPAYSMRAERENEVLVAKLPEKADAIFNKLMGTEVELRKNFIQANAKFVKDLDI